MKSESSHNINPSFLLKVLGAKNLNLKAKNLLIISKHKNDNEFDINKIKKISTQKGLLLDDINIQLDGHNITFKRLTKKQSKYLEFKLKNFKIIIKALEDIALLTNSRKFINHKLVISWIKNYKELLRSLNFYVKKNNLLSVDELKILKFYQNFEKLIKECNDHFIENEIRKFKPLFDKIEDNPLTFAQRKSIVIDEDSTLVVAGAGTGKTSTVVGKVSYLIKKNEIDSKEILVLAYGNNAAREVKERVKDKVKLDVTSKTFHSLGRAIVQNFEASKNKLSDAATSKFVLHNLFEHQSRLL